MTQAVTTVGLNACADAQKGGFLIDIARFGVTEATGFTAVASDTILAGTTAYEGDISVITVLTGNSAVEFVCELPIGVPTSGTLKIGEVGLYLASGELFSHGDVVPIYDKDNSFGLRFSVIVALAGLSDVINVTVTDTNSIPSVAYVRTLPRPIDGPENTVAVLDEWQNADSSYSPSIAIKYGPGNTRWGYVGYDRVFEGVPDSIDGTAFVLSPDNHGFLMEEDEIIIVQEVVNGNFGHSHKYQYKGNGRYELLDGSPGIIAQSILGLWRRIIPNVSNGVKIDFERFAFTTNDSGSYALTSAAQKDAYVVSWVDGIYQQDLQVAGTNITLTGVPNGLPFIGGVFKTTPTKAGEDPDYVQVDQFDFPSVTDTALTLPYTIEDRKWVFVFKQGRLMTEDRWDVYGTDVTLLFADDADGRDFQVVVFHKKTQSGGYSFDVVTHKQYTNGGININMSGLLASSAYLFFASGLLQAKSNYNIDAADEQIDLLTAGYYAGIEVKLVQFRSHHVEYFFAKSSDLDECFNSAEFIGRNLELRRHSGQAVDLLLPIELTVVPFGSSYDITKYGAGLIGFDAYNSPDMPTIDGSNMFFHGVVSHTEGGGKNPGGVQGFQMAVGWNTELNVPKGVFFRVKDDTQPHAGSWRRVAWYDEVAAVGTPLAAQMVSDPVQFTQDTTGQKVIAQVTSGVSPYVVSYPNGLPNGISALTVSGSDIVATYDATGLVGQASFTFYVSDLDGLRNVSLTANVAFVPSTPFDITILNSVLRYNTRETGQWALATVTSGLGPYIVTPSASVPGLTWNASADGTIAGIYDGNTATVGDYNVTYTVADRYGRIVSGTLEVIVSTAVLPPATTYSKAGTYTYTVPDGVYKVNLEAEGGGGSGGNSATGTYVKLSGTPLSGAICGSGGGGGGAGTKSAAVINVSPGDQLTVVVGAGGSQNPNSYSLNSAPNTYSAGLSCDIMFPDGNDGGPSYVQVAGANQVYGAGGKAGKGAVTKLKSVVYTGNYGSQSYSWTGYDSTGGAGGTLNGSAGVGGNTYGGKGGNGGASSVAAGGVGGVGGVNGGSGSQSGSDGQAGGTSAGGGGGGGDGYGAAWIHGRGAAGGDGWVRISPTN